MEGLNKTDRLMSSKPKNKSPNKEYNDFSVEDKEKLSNKNNRFIRQQRNAAIH
jgi:hypothetical protein